jgi:hypothetical protein
LRELCQRDEREFKTDESRKVLMCSEVLCVKSEAK